MTAPTVRKKEAAAIQQARAVLADPMASGAELTRARFALRMAVDVDEEPARTVMRELAQARALADRRDGLDVFGQPHPRPNASTPPRPRPPGTFRPYPRGGGHAA